jgi:hypothetical protein
MLWLAVTFGAVPLCSLSAPLQLVTRQGDVRVLGTLLLWSAMLMLRGSAYNCDIALSLFVSQQSRQMLTGCSD